MAKQVLATLIYVFPLLFFWSCTAEKKVEPANTTLTVRLPAAPQNLNPCTSMSAYAQQVNLKLFSSLLAFDPQDLSFQPFLVKQLPEVVPVEDNLTRYTYELHETARWDNGSPVLASDYIFSIKVFLNPYAGTQAFRSYLDFIERIELDPENPRKFSIFARNYFLIQASTGSIPVLPKYLFDPTDLMGNFSLREMIQFSKLKPNPEQVALLKQFGEQLRGTNYATNPEFLRGSGPYRLTEWIPDQRIVLSKKKDWWGDTLALDYPMLATHPPQIIYRPIVEEATMLTELKAEAIDVAGSLQANSYLDLQKNPSVRERFNLYAPPSLLYYYIALNGANPKLKDKKVRRALAHLLDVDGLITSVMQGFAERMHGPIHPSRPYFHSALPFIPFSVEKAQVLLQAAGWKDTNGDGILDKVIDGERVALSLSLKLTAGNDTGRKIAIFFKENARKAGVNIELETYEFSTLIDQYRQRDYEMTYRAWGLLETLDDLKQVWHTSSQVIPSGGNRVSFGNAQSDELIEAIRTSLDEQEREILYHKIQELIYEEQPYIFLFAPKERLAIHKRFTAQTSIKLPGYYENFFSVKQEEFVGN